MRQIVKVRAGTREQVTVAIPVGIRAVVPLKAGDRVMMTARGGQIILEPEKVNGSSKPKSKNR